MSAYAKLRRRRQLFVDAYVRTGVGSEAAIAAGYSSKGANVAASKFRANPEVAAAIVERQQEAIERAGVRDAQVLLGVCELAYANLNMLRDPETLKARTFATLPEALLAGAESIDFNPDGTVRKIRLARGSGLNMLAQHLKLFTSVLEHQGKDGGPIQLEAKEVSDLEKARRIAHLLAQGLRTAQLPASVLSDTDSGDEGAGDSTAPSTSATSS